MAASEEVRRVASGALLVLITYVRVYLLQSQSYSLRAHLPTSSTPRDRLRIPVQTLTTKLSLPPTSSRFLARYQRVKRRSSTWDSGSFTAS